MEDYFKELLNDDKFGLLMQNHARDVLEYLISFNIPFLIVANKNLISYNPDLSSETKANISSGEFTIFTLANFTLESAILNRNTLSFHASFTRDDKEGTIVEVPLGAIFEICLKDYPIFINRAIYKSRDKTIQNQISDSLRVFLSNPENQEFFK